MYKNHEDIQSEFTLLLIADFLVYGIFFSFTGKMGTPIYFDVQQPIYSLLNYVGLGMAASVWMDLTDLLVDRTPLFYGGCFTALSIFWYVRNLLGSVRSRRVRII